MVDAAEADAAVACAGVEEEWECVEDAEAQVVASAADEVEEEAVAEEAVNVVVVEVDSEDPTTTEEMAATIITTNTRQKVVMKVTIKNREEVAMVTVVTVATKKVMVTNQQQDTAKKEDTMSHTEVVKVTATVLTVDMRDMVADMAMETLKVDMEVVHPVPLPVKLAVAAEASVERHNPEAAVEAVETPPEASLIEHLLNSYDGNMKLFVFRPMRTQNCHHQQPSYIPEEPAEDLSKTRQSTIIFILFYSQWNIIYLLMLP